MDGAPWRLLVWLAVIGLVALCVLPVIAASAVAIVAWIQGV
jgi:hypothetical protein